MTPEQESMALRYDPFAGDKDDGGWVHLSDRMVTARKGGPCAMPCGEHIIPGTRVRRMTAVLPGEGVRTIRFCEPCCEAMALSSHDDGAAVEARFKAPWLNPAAEKGPTP